MAVIKNVNGKKHRIPIYLKNVLFKTGDSVTEKFLFKKIVMKWINQNKWAICYISAVLSFSFLVPASNNLCQNSFSSNEEISNNLLDKLLFKTSLSRMAELDRLTIQTSKLSLKHISDDPAFLALYVLQHPDLFNKYGGGRGLLLYAGVYFNGDIWQAKHKVKSHLSPDEFYKLGWPRYIGPIWNLVETYNWKTFMAGGWIFRGMEGYALIANLYFEGNMVKAFDETLIMSGFSTEAFIKRFGWKRFEGFISYFYQHRRKVTNRYGQIVKKYRRQNGWDLLIKDFYKYNRSNAHRDMKAVLSVEELKYLRWSNHMMK